MNTNALRKNISASAIVAKDWFFKNATEKEHDEWNARGQLEDKSIGAVYAFFNANGRCLYIGQTTQTLKQRANVQTAFHYQADWWENWRCLRFVNIPNQTDQLVLETLLILALHPPHNRRPAARRIGQMFQL